MNTIINIFKASNSDILPISLVVEQTGLPTPVAEQKIQSAIKVGKLVRQGNNLCLPEDNSQLKKDFIFLRKNEAKLSLVTLMKGINEFNKKHNFKYNIFNNEVRKSAIKNMAYIPPTNQERKAFNKVLQS